MPAYGRKIATRTLRVDLAWGEGRELTHFQNLEKTFFGDRFEGIWAKLKKYHNCIFGELAPDPTLILERSPLAQSDFELA